MCVARYGLISFPFPLKEKGPPASHGLTVIWVAASVSWLSKTRSHSDECPRKDTVPVPSSGLTQGTEKGGVQGTYKPDSSGSRPTGLY